MVVAAIQSCQRRVSRHDEGGQLVVAAIQSCQRRVSRHIEGGQLVVFAVQGLQRREAFDALQVCDILFGDIDCRHSCKPCSGDISAFAIVLAEEPIAEVLVGEYHLADEHPWRIVGQDGDRLALAIIAACIDEFAVLN